jgi:hypothetical protein
MKMKPSIRFRDHFDRIAVISLPQRSDRRERLTTNLRQRGLAEDSDLTWVDAVDGHQATLPTWWQAGPGAWGCRASQLAVLESAQRDGLETVLILEDDAHFHQRSQEWLAMIMPLVPGDWDFLFLGGQHMAEPRRTHDPRLLKGTAITRTHAYAVHCRAFSSLIEQVSDLSAYQAHSGWHIDHQYARGIYDGRWLAYAPAWWLAAQEEGESDIGQHTFSRRWWITGDHYWRLPFVSVSETNINTEWVYHPEISDDTVPENTLARALWLRNVAHEAWMQGRLPACPVSAEEITRLWPGGHRSISSLAELAQLADYPANRLFSHPFVTTTNTQTNKLA